MGTFVAIEGRVAHPLLPLGIVTDRDRGGSYLAVLLAAAGMFGVFLFITYYLQRTRGYTPLSTGLAFLPMVAALIITSAVANTQLLPRVGPKPLIPLGMVLAACGLVIFTQLGLDSAYAGHVLPGLVLVGLGLGLVMPPAMNTATAGVAPADAGAASATANAGQQIGGAIGTSLLNTMFATAVSSYLAGKVPSASLAAHATLHGYTTAFWWSIGIFLTGGGSAACCCARERHGSFWPPSRRSPDHHGGRHISVVTISASFGAGGSWVAPRVAERLGSRFIDRAIPVGVAEQLAVPLEHAWPTTSPPPRLVWRAWPLRSPLPAAFGCPSPPTMPSAGKPNA